jgi:hypothetical protein
LLAVTCQRSSIPRGSGSGAVAVVVPLPAGALNVRISRSPDWDVIRKV